MPGRKVFTFRYDRTTGGGGGGTTSYYKVTVHYLDADGNEIANSYVTPSIREGGSWDVSDKQLETITVGEATYTFAYADGDDLIGSNIRSDKVVNLYYETETDIDDGETPLGPGPDGETVEPGDGGEVEIPDDETPLGPGPDGETETTIEDGKVPQANLPQTGASMTTISPFVVVSALSLAAVMTVAGVVYTIGRKKEDDNQ